MKTEEELQQIIDDLQHEREVLRKEIEETQAKIDMYKKVIPHEYFE